MYAETPTEEIAINARYKLSFKQGESDLFMQE